MKGWIKTLIGFGIVVLGVFLFAFMRKSKEETLVAEKKEVKMVSTRLVVPTAMPFVIETTGTLSAKKKIELYSEVQGILLSTKTAFRAGNKFYKNQPLLQINSAEHRAQLLSSRSAFMNKIAGMLPDMEVEFPSNSKKWESYLKELKVDKPLRDLPKPESDSEHLFLTGKGIYENYYSIKNLEERLSKYTLRAPFSGTVTESLVNEGTLVRSGQKLGEFIDASLFEINLEVPARYHSYVKQGKEVWLRTLDDNYELKGKVSRINAKIDADTQTVVVVVELSDKNLKEGQFLKGVIFGERIKNVVKIDNNLLKENNHVYIVKDSMLQLQQVVPMNYVGDSVVVHGLKSNTILVDEVLANAYPGMKVLF